MQCSVCHNEVPAQAAFCNHCGANLASTVPPPETPFATAPASSVPPGYIPPPVAATSGLSPNAAAAISYITFIPAVIFLIVEPYNRIPFVRFHSFQSIGLTIAAFVLHFAAALFLPLGFVIHSVVQSLISLCLFILWLMLVIKASQGEWFKLPIIGDLALKQAQS